MKLHELFDRQSLEVLQAPPVALTAHLPASVSLPITLKSQRTHLPDRHLPLVHAKSPAHVAPAPPMR